eukprot:5342130-Alexandrium_andersonii.AAC.1
MRPEHVPRSPPTGLSRADAPELSVFATSDPLDPRCRRQMRNPREQIRRTPPSELREPLFR